MLYGNDPWYPICSLLCLDQTITVLLKCTLARAKHSLRLESYLSKSTHTFDLVDLQMLLKPKIDFILYVDGHFKPHDSYIILI